MKSYKRERDHVYRRRQSQSCMKQEEISRRFLDGPCFEKTTKDEHISPNHTEKMLNPIRVRHQNGQVPVRAKLASAVIKRL